MRLRDLQMRCHRAFVRGDVDAVAPFVRGGTLPPAACVRIYQNNARETFRKTLAASFPTVASLVGEECFATLARDYMRAHESRTGNLIDYGAAFPELLAAHYAGGAFDYLIEVARFDWAIERAQIASDAMPLDLAGLAAVPPERHGDLRFSLHPACTLIDSRYPVLSIRQWHQRPDGGEPIRLDGAPERVLVTRRRDEVVMRALSPAEHRFVGALAVGSRLADATATAGVGFDPTAALVLLAELEQLVHFSTEPSVSRSPVPCSQH